MARENREKLTDVINITNYVFSRKVDSFTEAYPTIAKLRVEVTESDLGVDKPKYTRTFTEGNFSHAVNCHNSLCYRGGVELGWIIHDMVRNKQTDLEETKLCQGYEGSPKGKSRYGSCLHMFHIKALVEYKD